MAFRFENRSDTSVQSGFGRRKKTILVAGGAGFLGSQLCDRFVADGDSVICVDNLLTGYIENISNLMNRPNFRFVKQDVIEPIEIAGEIDEIYNLACAASPPKYQIDPIHTFKTNIWGAMNLLELARDKGAKILQASTSEVYGDPEVPVQSESYFGNVNINGPRSCYDEGKRAAETLFCDYHEAHGVPTKIARIFNTYGPGMAFDDGRVVSNFVNQALRGLPILVNGTGRQTRSFCYCSDLIEGLVRLMATPDDVSGPINLGNPTELTMLELANAVLEKTGAQVSIVHQPLPKDDPRQRRPDISKAKRILNWEPRVDLSRGLDMTIAYFESQQVWQRNGMIGNTA